MPRASQRQAAIGNPNILSERMRFSPWFAVVMMLEDRPPRHLGRYGGIGSWRSIQQTKTREENCIPAKRALSADTISAAPMTDV
jgi:hypothetical protein